MRDGDRTTVYKQGRGGLTFKLFGLYTFVTPLIGSEPFDLFRTGLHGRKTFLHPHDIYKHFTGGSTLIVICADIGTMRRQRNHGAIETH